MKRPFVANRKLNELYKQEQNKYMMYRIGNAKSSVKMDCPESFLFFRKTHKTKPKRNICNLNIYIIFIIKSFHIF